MRDAFGVTGSRLRDAVGVIGSTLRDANGVILRCRALYLAVVCVLLILVEPNDIFGVPQSGASDTNGVPQSGGSPSKHELLNFKSIFKGVSKVG